MSTFDLKRVNTFDKHSINIACEELYTSYSKEFCAFCQSYSNNHFRPQHRMDPDEVFSISFSRLWSNLNTGKVKPEDIDHSLYAYFKAIGINVMRENARQKGHEESLDQTDSEGKTKQLPDLPDEEYDVALEAREEVIRECVKTIGDPCHKILKSKWWDDRPMADIAADLGYSGPTTAKSTHHRCMDKLKDIIKRKFVELGIEY